MILNKEDYYSRQKFPIDLFRSGGTGSSRYSTGTGYPAGVSITAVADGVLKTKTDASFPLLPDSPSGLLLTKCVTSHNIFFSQLCCSSLLLDILASHGTYSFNANYTLVNPPTIPANRFKNSDYLGAELWVYIVSNFTGQPTFTYSYLNQDGVLKSNTFNSAFTPNVGTTYRLPLAVTDTGVQKLISIQCSVATVGSFSIYIARKLVDLVMRNRTRNNDIYNFLDSELIWMKDDSAIMHIIMNPQNTTWYATINFEVVKV